MQCVLCGGNALEPVLSQTWPIIGVGDYAVRFAVCPDCGYIGQNPQPTTAQLAAYYEQYSNYTVLTKNFTPPSKPAWDVERALFLARNVLPDGGTIFEAGCGSGKILYWFRQMGWTARGCDYSANAVAQANALYGLDCEAGAFEDILPSQDDLDIVLFWHVIEHLPDPVGALRRVGAAVKPGGYVLFEVPVAMDADILQPGWLAFEHLSYFSLGTVETLLSQAGLRMVDQLVTTRRHNYPTVAVLAQKGMPAATVNHYAHSRQFLDTYLGQERQFWQEVRDRIEGIRGDYVVWAGGVHTSRLMAECGIKAGGACIAITDSDGQKWGQQLRGIPVMPWQDVPERMAQTYVISTYSGETAILKYLRGQGVPDGQIITLYGDGRYNRAL